LLSRPSFILLAMQRSGKRPIRDTADGCPNSLLVLWIRAFAQDFTFQVHRRQEMSDVIIKIGAMPSDRLVSATPALADEHEALLAEARNTADRLRLILDISHTIVADLELQDLLQVVSASLRRALQCDAAAITVADTQAEGELTSRSTQPPASSSGARKDMQSVLDDTERQHILRALEDTNLVIVGPNGAAARLGMKRSTLHARMQKLGVQITRSGPSQ
jgi:transcriptional regulator with GAF, ATPase, and Fis domain